MCGRAWHCWTVQAGSTLDLHCRLRNSAMHCAWESARPPSSTRALQASSSACHSHASSNDEIRPFFRFAALVQLLFHLWLPQECEHLAFAFDVHATCMQAQEMRACWPLGCVHLTVHKLHHPVIIRCPHTAPSCRHKMHRKNQAPHMMSSGEATEHWQQICALCR